MLKDDAQHEPNYDDDQDYVGQMSQVFAHGSLSNFGLFWRRLRHIVCQPTEWAFLPATGRVFG